MTTAPAIFTPHPLVRIHPGDIIWTWCSKAMDRTDHMYTGYNLVCLHCHPERDPRREGNDDRSTVSN